MESVREYRDTQTSPNQKWKIIDQIQHTFNRDFHYRLSDLGAHEMEQISQRFMKRFPNLFTNLTDNHIDLISSSKERSTQSAYHFLKGINLENLSSKMIINDRMMRLFDECDNYDSEVKKNQTAYEELILFGQSDFIVNLTKRFKERHDLLELNIEPSN